METSSHVDSDMSHQIVAFALILNRLLAFQVAAGRIPPTPPPPSPRRKCIFWLFKDMLKSATEAF